MARHADFIRLYEILASWRVPWEVSASQQSAMATIEPDSE
jgi:hypothetical protein